MTYKILTHGQICVDANMLRNGIYETSIPTLYSAEMTLEDLAKKYVNVLATFKEDVNVIQTILANMSKCELVEVELTIK
jgi:hypothetical protein